MCLAFAVKFVLATIALIVVGSVVGINTFMLVFYLIVILFPVDEWVGLSLSLKEADED